MSYLAVCLSGVGCGARTDAPSIRSVEPEQATNGQQTSITIHGEHFYIEAHIDLGTDRAAAAATTFAARLDGYELEDVVSVDTRTLTARVPAALPPDLYDLTVVTPSGASDTLTGGFTVTAASQAPMLYAEVAAPSTVTQGQGAVPVHVTVTAGGTAGQALTLVEAELRIAPFPERFSVTRTNAVASVPVGESRVLTFAVDVGADAQPGAHTLDARVVGADAAGVPVSLGFDDPASIGDSWEVLAAEQPSSLTLTAPSTSALCEQAILSIDLDGVAGAASDIRCAAPRQTLHGPADFAGGDDGGWSVATSATVGISIWPSVFSWPSCVAGGRFMQFSLGAGFLQLGEPVNVLGFEALSVGAVVGYAGGPEAGEHLSVLMCCGASCDPTTEAGFFANAADGGTDTCRSESVSLPAAASSCRNLMLRFNWPVSFDFAGIDDIELTGELSFSPMIDEGAGFYSTSIVSCMPMQLAVVCTLDDSLDPSLFDAALIEFQ